MENRNTPFWDSALPIEKRLDWLIAEMTIEEKLECLAAGDSRHVTGRRGGPRGGGQKRPE